MNKKKASCKFSYFVDYDATAFSLSHNGTDLAVGGPEFFAIIDLQNPNNFYHNDRVEEENINYDEPITEIDWNPIYKENVAAASSNSFELYKVAKGSIIPDTMVPAYEDSKISDIAWHYFDPHLLATSSDEDVVYLWDIRSNRHMSSLPDAAGASKLAWSKKFSHHLATSIGMVVKIWDSRRPATPIFTLEGHNDFVTCIDWSPFEDTQILTASQDNEVHVHDLIGKGCLDKKIKVDAPLQKAKFTPFQGGVVTTVGPEDSPQSTVLSLWSLGNLANPVYQFQGHTNSVLDFDWRSKDEVHSNFTLSSWSKDNILCVWNGDHRMNFRDLCHLPPLGAPALPTDFDNLLDTIKTEPMEFEEGDQLSTSFPHLQIPSKDSLDHDRFPSDQSSLFEQYLEPHDVITSTSDQQFLKPSPKKEPKNRKKNDNKFKLGLSPRAAVETILHRTPAHQPDLYEPVVSDASDFILPDSLDTLAAIKSISKEPVSMESCLVKSVTTTSFEELDPNEEDTFILPDLSSDMIVPPVTPIDTIQSSSSSTFKIDFPTIDFNAEVLPPTAAANEIILGDDGKLYTIVTDATGVQNFISNPILQKTGGASDTLSRDSKGNGAYDFNIRSEYNEDMLVTKIFVSYSTGTDRIDTFIDKKTGLKQMADIGILIFEEKVESDIPLKKTIHINVDEITPKENKQIMLPMKPPVNTTPIVDNLIKRPEHMFKINQNLKKLYVPCLYERSQLLFYGKTAELSKHIIKKYRKPCIQLCSEITPTLLYDKIAELGPNIYFIGLKHYLVTIDLTLDDNDLNVNTEVSEPSENLASLKYKYKNYNFIQISGYEEESSKMSKLDLINAESEGLVRAYGCMVCSKKNFRTKLSMNLHMIKFHEEENTPLQLPAIPQNIFSCNMCGKIFHYQYMYEEHCRNFHGQTITNAEPVKTKSTLKPPSKICFICNYSSESLISTERHIEDDHKFERTQSDTMKCLICNSEYQSEVNIKSHALMHAKENDGIVEGIITENENQIQPNDAAEKYKDFAHQCRVCGKSFRSKKQILLHLVIHTSLRLHKCEICGEDFTFRRTLVRHCNEIHPEISVQVCKLCNESFKTISKLKRHQCPAVYDDYHCPYCDFKTSTDNRLNLHLAKFHNNGNCCYYCFFCKQHFDNSSKFRYHQTSNHREEYNMLKERRRQLKSFEKELGKSPVEEPIKDDDLQIVVVGKKLLYTVNPRLGEPVEKDRSVVCYYCNATFSTKNAMKRHISLMHPDRPRFHCTICNFVFESNMQYVNHIKTYHQPNPLPNIEVMEVDTFQESLSLSVPEVVALNCPSCSLRFETLDRLKEHQKSFHSPQDKNTNLRPKKKKPTPVNYACSFIECDLIFDDKNLIEHHLQAAHNVTFSFEDHYKEVSKSRKKTKQIKYEIEVKPENDPIILINSVEKELKENKNKNKKNKKKKNTNKEISNQKEHRIEKVKDSGKVKKSGKERISGKANKNGKAKDNEKVMGTERVKDSDNVKNSKLQRKSKLLKGTGILKNSDSLKRGEVLMSGDVLESCEIAKAIKIMKKSGKEKSSDKEKKNSDKKKKKKKKKNCGKEKKNCDKEKNSDKEKKKNSDKDKKKKNSDKKKKKNNNINKEKNSGKLKKMTDKLKKMTDKLKKESGKLNKKSGKLNKKSGMLKKKIDKLKKKIDKAKTKKKKKNDDEISNKCSFCKKNFENFLALRLHKFKYNENSCKVLSEKHQKKIVDKCTISQSKVEVVDYSKWEEFLQNNEIDSAPSILGINSYCEDSKTDLSVKVGKRSTKKKVTFKEDNSSIHYYPSGKRKNKSNETPPKRANKRRKLSENSYSTPSIELSSQGVSDVKKSKVSKPRKYTPRKPNIKLAAGGFLDDVMANEAVTTIDASNDGCRKVSSTSDFGHSIIHNIKEEPMDIEVNDEGLAMSVSVFDGLMPVIGEEEVKKEIEVNEELSAAVNKQVIRLALPPFSENDVKEEILFGDQDQWIFDKDDQKKVLNRKNTVDKKKGKLTVDPKGITRSANTAKETKPKRKYTKRKKPDTEENNEINENAHKRIKLEAVPTEPNTLIIDTQVDSDISKLPIVDNNNSSRNKSKRTNKNRKNESVELKAKLDIEGITIQDQEISNDEIRAVYSDVIPKAKRKYTRKTPIQPAKADVPKPQPAKRGRKPKSEASKEPIVVKTRGRKKTRGTPCEICQEVFTTQAELKIHLKFDHNKASVNRRKVPVTVCAVLE